MEVAYSSPSSSSLTSWLAVLAGCDALQFPYATSCHRLLNPLAEEDEGGSRCCWTTTTVGGLGDGGLKPLQVTTDNKYTVSAVESGV